jgi:Ca-activated chloride channel family protein
MKTIETKNPGTFITLVIVITISLIAIGISLAVNDARIGSTITLSSKGGGSIHGTVKDSITGKAVSAARIFLYNGTTQVAVVSTDLNGVFLIRGIPAGNYNIRVVKKAYTDHFEQNIIVTDNQTINLSILFYRSGEINLLNKKDKEKPVAVLEMEAAMPAQYDRKGAAAKSCYGVTGSMPMVADEGYTEFNTESYDKVNENNFKTVTNSPLSTFSIDVDRASYSNVRRFLNNNTMPYKDAVRIEEMINYFDYTYPQPVNRDPFSVNLEASDCPWNKDHKLVLIGIKGKEFRDNEVPKSNLVFLIDVSGSMQDANKLPLIKQAFHILVKNLRPVDRVAIVVYAGAAGVVLESTPGSEKEKILASIDRLEAGGSTAGGEGIRLAYQIAKQNYLRDGNNRVILATDGDFNIGASSDAEMTRLIEEKRKDGIYVSILGFGMGNYKDSKMEKIADAGNGNYYYVDNIMEAQKIFGEELWGTLFTIAKDVKIQVEFNPEKVKAYRLIGYENRLLNNEDFNDDHKDAGEIGAGHTVTALYEIVPAGSDETFSNVDPLEYQKTNITGGSGVMTVKLRYKEPSDTTSKLIVAKVKDQDLKNTNVSDNLRFASSVAEFGMLLRNSEHKGASAYEQVIAMATASKGVDKYGYRQEFIKLAQIASLLGK